MLPSGDDVTWSKVQLFANNPVDCISWLKVQQFASNSLAISFIFLSNNYYSLIIIRKTWSAVWNKTSAEEVSSVLPGIVATTILGFTDAWVSTIILKNNTSTYSIKYKDKFIGKGHTRLIAPHITLVSCSSSFKSELRDTSLGSR